MSFTAVSVRLADFEGRGPVGYDGFISYSHAADGQFAPALQRGLQRFARPWNARRALRIFRDETGLSTNPHLWSAIESALDESEWFVLLASAEAAQSEWVNKEISHWLATKSVDHLLPVVTDGSWEWDAASGDFTAESTAVPDALRGALADEPRHLDLRWARDETDLVLRNSRFRGAVADLAAPMHGMAKDELEGEDIRQHRRARRLARGGIAALATLVVIALIATGLAVKQRDRANEQSRLADARRLATVAVNGTRDDLFRSALLGIEANRLVDSAETRGALLSLAEDAAPVRAIVHGDWNAAAIAPDGRTVATIGRRGISVVDLETGRTRVLSHRNFQNVGTAAFSPDGRLLALGSDDVRILDAHTGVPSGFRGSIPARPPKRPKITKVRFSPDGTTVAAIASDGGAVWSVATGTRVGPFPTGDVGSFDLSFSPDGRWLGITGNGGVLLDAHSLQPRYARPPSGTFRDREQDITFSPDGSRFAVTTGGAGQTNSSGIVVRDSTNGAVVTPSIPVASGDPGRLAYSPDGRSIAATLSDGTVSEWNAASGALLHDALVGPTRAPIAMSFAPDGSTVVVTNSEIVVLDPAAQLAREIAAPDAPAYVNSLAVSPDGRSLAGTDGAGRVRVWDVGSGRLRRTITVTTAFGPGASAVAYQPGTGTIVVGAGDGTVTAWNPKTGKRIGAPIRLTAANTGVARFDPGLGVQGVAFDARGRTLVASTTSSRVAVIDPTSWTVRRTFHLVDDAIEFLNPLAISPDGRTVALAGPRVVAISDIDGTHRRQVPVGPVRATAVAFQPDGRGLGAAVEDGRILVIDPTTARLRTTLVSNLAISLAFNRTGSTLATGGGDGSVVLWNLADGQPLGPPLTSSQHGTVVETLTFSANGDTVFAGSSNGSLVRYQLASSRWIDQLCAVIGRNLTSNERDAYLADSNAGRRTCPNWPVAP